jgi:hypothetical protein
MDRTLEEPVKERIKKMLALHCAYYTMPPANGYGRAGGFDFTCCVNGLFLGIEAKRDKHEKPTQLQTDNAEAAYAAGGIVLLIHSGNLDVLRRTLEQMKEEGAHPMSFWPREKPSTPDDIPQPVLRRRTE